MTNHEDILIDEIGYDCIVWTCERCGCEMVVDIDGLPMIKDGKARNVIEPTFCPECGCEQAEQIADEAARRLEQPELKPCPFCGNEPTVETESCCTETGYSVRCIYRDCKVSPSTYLCETKKQAIEAWNTRAERTCQAEYRTGGNEFGAFYCSVCNNYMDEHDRYCPSCGAKVVVEE